MKAPEVKFVSYDGGYPNLCSGALVLSLAGKDVEFPNYCMSSGGTVIRTEDGDMDITEGPWEIIDWPEERKQIAESVVNSNVVQGCWGGCI